MYFFEMLQTILRYLTHIFPHTSARLAYWHFLLFYDDTGLLDLHNLVIAILPTCIYFLDIAAYVWAGNDDDDDETPFERRGSLRVLNDGIRYWLLITRILELICGLDLVLRASGFWGRIMLAVDLAVESHLLLLANFMFSLSVGFFIGAALRGFSYVKDVLTMVWIILDMLWMDFNDEILNRQEPIEADFEEDEAPEDDLFHNG